MHGRSQHTMSRQAARRDVLRLLKVADDQVSAIGEIDVLHLLDHFLNDKSSWIGSPHNQRVLQRDGVQMALEAPHFLHAILAFSAGHLNHLQPNPRVRGAAILHCARLLALYSAQLSRLSSENVTQAFGTCTLLGYLSYLGVSQRGIHPRKLELIYRKLRSHTTMEVYLMTLKSMFAILRPSGLCRAPVSFKIFPLFVHAFARVSGCRRFWNPNIPQGMLWLYWSNPTTPGLLK